MRWLVKIAAVYLVTLLILLTIITLESGSSTGRGAPVHERMDPVSHSDYELHKSIAHIP